MGKWLPIAHRTRLPPIKRRVKETCGLGVLRTLFGVPPQKRGIPEGARAEAHQLFDNLVAILAACGAGLSDVVRVGIVMRDLQHNRPVFDEVWVERFGEHRPARATIQSPAFSRSGERACFMVEAAAYRG
jgi:2-iminobutanoate/2-iminopropanoate deaminase